MREALTTAEQAQVKTLAAAGWPPYRIGKQLGRSPHTISKFLKQPEVVTAVKDEKAALSDLYRGKARAILESVDAPTIAKAGLRDKAVASGIFLDKSLVLSGELPPVDVKILLQIMAVIRGDDQDEPPPALPTLPEGPK